MFPMLNPTSTSLPIPSLWGITVHQPRASCIMIKPGLAIHFTYDILHVSMPFSKSSHPRPLPQSPKDCSIYLCLFCCLAYRVIVTIFLNSIYMRSVQFSRSVMSDSLRPHESQHAKPPCLSPTPGVHSNSCPSSR